MVEEVSGHTQCRAPAGHKKLPKEESGCRRADRSDSGRRPWANATGHSSSNLIGSWDHR